MARGGLELESFSINPPRITILRFLPQWLCAEMEVISLPEFMYNYSFSTLLQHVFVYLKVSPQPYFIFALQLHTFPLQSICNFKVGELPSKIPFAASDILQEVFSLACFPLDASRNSFGFIQVCLPSCQAASSSISNVSG